LAELLRNFLITRITTATIKQPSPAKDEGETVCGRPEACLLVGKAVEKFRSPTFRVREKSGFFPKRKLHPPIGCVPMG